MDYSPSGFFVHGISQEYWNGLLFPFPGDLPHPGIELMSASLADGFFTTEPFFTILYHWEAYHLSIYLYLYLYLYLCILGWEDTLEKG